MEPRKASAAAASSWSDGVDLLLHLPEMSLDERAAAVEILMRNPSPGIRQQALRVGAAVFPDERLVEFLRDEADAVRRNAGSEIFRLRGSRSLSVVVALLADAEPDVVLQAVLILARMRDPRALEPLHGVLSHPDPNVVQEALLAIGQLGDHRSVARLVPFLDEDPWVQLAAVQALGDLRAPEAVAPLAAKILDPLAGFPAAEALARIGGQAAFAALAALWLSKRTQPEGDELLGLLAYVAEGLEDFPSSLPDGFRSALSARLAESAGATRTATARCLLALGTSLWDVDALQVLLAEPGAGNDLPPALSRRSDLLMTLISLPGKAVVWGLRLAAKLPPRQAVQRLAPRLAGIPGSPDVVAVLAESLVQISSPGLAEPLLELYLRLAPESRALLLPALESRAEEMRQALAAHPEIDGADAVALGAALGASVDLLLPRLLALPAALCRTAVSQLVEREDLVRSLPWEQWLREDGGAFANLAADAAGRHHLRDLLPALRQQAEQQPSVPLLLALGELRDEAAVPLLLDLLNRSPALRPVALECLGKIGSAAARAALRDALAGGSADAEIRVAYRALATCAEPHDEPLFRQAAHHPDWYVRLVAAEHLATAAARPENLACLTLLAADPVSAVAHRALRALED